MYCLEGELVVRKDPEQLLGQFGCYFLDEDRYAGPDGAAYIDRRLITRTGDEGFVTQSRAQLIEDGEIIPETPMEHITSIEQAEKYTTPNKKKLHVVKHRLPDLDAILGRSVPDELELLEGSAMLWKDRRYPAPYLYFLAKGVLLAEVEYDQEAGWHHAHDEVSGSRTVTGIGILFAHRTKTDYETKGVSRNGYQLSETTSKGTTRSRGYDFHVGFNLKLGSKKTGEGEAAAPELAEGDIIKHYTGTRYRVDGFTTIAEGYEKTGKLVPGVKYTQLDDGEVNPAGTEYVRSKQEILHGTTKHEGKKVPIFEKLDQE
jgi:hypothetical protein